MNNKLTCSQVLSLINFYIDGKLNPTLEEYVREHIKNCPHCKEKISELESILNKYKKSQLNITKQETTANQSLRKSLSAYIDNELNYNDNIKIKKFTISNNNARKELEIMYKFQKLIRSAYEQTKKENKKDFSKYIIAEITNNDYYIYAYFRKLALIFVIIVMLIICGFLYLYF